MLFKENTFKYKMSNLICEYCNNSYSSKSSLNNHQKSTKKCLEIQKNLNKIIKKVEFTCTYCDKKFTSKQNIKNHEIFCDVKKTTEYSELKEKYETEIEDLKRENQNLRETVAGLQGELKNANKASDCVYEIAKQPKNNNNITNNNSSNSSNTTTNNNNNKTLNISTSIDFKNINKVKEIIDEKYDINHILSGQKGCAQFAAQYLLVDDNGKYVYLCTDPSRNTFKFKNEIGEIEKDIEAKKLTNYLVDGGLQEKAKHLSLNWCQNDGVIDQEKFLLITEKQLSIMNIKDNNSEFKRELSSIISS